MKSKLITSCQLLEEAGIATEQRTAIPVAYRHLFITSVLEFVPAHKLKDLLVANEVDVTLREVTSWLQASRVWLGLPSAGRGKPSAELREAIQLWREANGNPTIEEIDAGWVPDRTLERDQLHEGKVAPDYSRTFKEVRSQVACLYAAIDDDEAKRLLDFYLRQIRGR